MELIKLGRMEVGGEAVQTVNARELHGFLGVGKDFSNWIKDRIEQYNFIDNQDFVIFANSGEKSGRGRPSIDYHISIDMAKELAMVERNDKGKEARQYFIECEKRLKDAVPSFQIPQTYAEALQLAADQARQIEAARPAVEFVERYVDARGNDSKCLSDVAKLLGWNPRSFIRKLGEDGIIFKRDGCWIPYQPHVDEGRFRVTTGEVEGKRYFQARVRPKGVNWLAGIYG